MVYSLPLSAQFSCLSITWTTVYVCSRTSSQTRRRFSVCSVTRLEQTPRYTRLSILSVVWHLGGCLWCLAYNILGESKHALRPSGPARVWASMRDESAAVAELSRRRNLWKRSRNCMPDGEFLNSKTMLTKILLTYTAKLNVAFFGLVRLTNLKSRKYCMPANAIGL